MAVHVARLWKGRGAYRVWVGRYDGKRLLGRPRRRWKDNIEFYLQNIGWGFVDWIALTQDTDRCRALVTAVMNWRFPQHRVIYFD